MKHNSSQLLPVISRHRIIAIVVFIISLLTTQVISWRLLQAEKASTRERVVEEALSVKNRMESVLRHSITATYTLSFLVRNDLLGENFDSVSHQLLEQNQHIDAMQLLKGTTIVKTYPLEGNESVIGFDISEDPVHKREMRKAQNRRNLYFEGPFELRQGGIGVVGRLPVFVDGELWGFSAVVIRMETLYSAIGMPQSGKSEQFQYQLAKLQEDGTETVFLDGQKIDEEVYHKEMVPIGDWVIYVKSVNDSYIDRSLPFILLGVVFSLILAAFIWQILSQPYRLRQQVEAQTKDLQRMNMQMENHAKRLSESNAHLEHFSHIISHDLQEPLRMITSFLDLLKKRYGGQLDSKADEYIHYATDGAERMRYLILDLLGYSRAGKTDQPVQPVSLTDIMEDVVHILQKEIESHQAQIHYQDLPMVNAHHTSLQQIFQNLISNAIKYSEPERSPEIYISVEKQDQHWLLSVKDNGIGIEEEYHDEIFEIFRRLHRRETYAGSGIGLAIVKKNVESHGGKIWVVSQEGEGSTFFFTIPHGDGQ